MEHGIRSPRGTGSGNNSGVAEERILRAKYLDWCSARIAERFLELTPEEIYELAQKAPGEKVGVSHGAVSTSAHIGEPEPWPLDSEPVESFKRIVERVTSVLAATLPLPSFEDWAESYRQNPGRYDEELLGFWRESST